MAKTNLDHAYTQRVFEDAGGSLSNRARALLAAITAALLAPNVAFARFRCEETNVASTMKTFRERAASYGYEVVNEGSQSFPVNAYYGVAFWGETGYYYDSYVSFPVKGQIKLQILDPMQAYTSYANEALSTFAMELPFQCNQPGLHTLAVGSIANLPSRCFYYMVVRRHM